VDWIQVSLDRVQWRALVNTVANPRFHKRREFLDQLSDFQFLKKDPAPYSWLGIALYF